MKILSQVLRFAVPYLIVGVVEMLCKHRKKICEITERMVSMTDKFYKQIFNMLARWTNLLDSFYGIQTL